jgi:holo-[acyl-carrier protein] synthase
MSVASPPHQIVTATTIVRLGLDWFWHCGEGASWDRDSNSGVTLTVAIAWHRTACGGAPDECPCHSRRAKGPADLVRTDVANRAGGAKGERLNTAIPSRPGAGNSSDISPKRSNPVVESSLVVGVDLVRVSDVADSIARFGERYSRRLFTEREIGDCTQYADLAAERFAARFAAKEATMKVLRPCAADAVAWRSIEVLRSTDGWCEIVLHDAAAVLARRKGISCLALTMSHEHEYATATVIGSRAVGGLE